MIVESLAIKGMMVRNQDYPDMELPTIVPVVRSSTSAWARWASKALRGSSRKMKPGAIPQLLRQGGERKS